MYLVDGGSVGIGKVFDVAASISASYYEVFIIVFDTWWSAKALAKCSMEKH